MFLQLSVDAQEIRKMNIDELENYIQTRSQPAVINFWATWCAPCIEEMPSFNKIIGST
jgi:thiol-disulfide isomerase/thioredoxin